VAVVTNYVIKRIAYALLTIFLISVITFALMNMIPGGPFLSEKAVSPETTQALKVKYGLDKPLYVQYGNYMSNLLHGDFGLSIKQKGRTANDIIFSTFPVSARLAGISILLALVLGVTMGSVAALNRGKWADSVLMVISTMGIAVPGFVVASFLLITFGVNLHVLPTLGLKTPLHYIMPVAALSFYPTAYITRLMRSSMLDALNQDYIRTAKAKGVSKFSMLFKHALKNAIIPVITYVGPLLAYTMTGSFVVEKIFTIPGLGREFINCITGRDYPMVMSTTLFLAILLVFMNVIVDICYKLVDPRIKLK